MKRYEVNISDVGIIPKSMVKSWLERSTSGSFHFNKWETGPLWFPYSSEPRTYGRVRFKKETDATLFVLTFGGKMVEVPR